MLRQRCESLVRILALVAQMAGAATFATMPADAQTRLLCAAAATVAPRTGKGGQLDAGGIVSSTDWRATTDCASIEPATMGAKVWVPPQNRAVAVVPEPGPLAERAKLILENSVAIMLREDLAHNLPRRSFYYGFQWSVAEGRTFIVSQARKRTDIILQDGKTYCLTLPSRQLERVMGNEYVAQLDPWKEIP